MPDPTFNTLIAPNSGFISFSNDAPGSSNLPSLSSSARIVYTAGGGLTITSKVSSMEKFAVEGRLGTLFTVTDAVSGALFQLRDVTGFPVVEFLDNGDLFTTGAITAAVSLSSPSLSANLIKVGIIYGSKGNDITTGNGTFIGGAGGYIDLTGGDGDGGNECPGSKGGYIKMRGSTSNNAPNGAGYIDTSAYNEGDGGYIDTSGGGYEGTHGGYIKTKGGSTNNYTGGYIDTSGGGQGPGGYIDTSDNGGYIKTTGTYQPGGYIDTSSKNSSGSIGGNIITNGGTAVDCPGGIINTSGGSEDGSSGGSINTSGGSFAYAVGGNINTSGSSFGAGGDINTSGTNNVSGGYINTSGGGYIDTTERRFSGQESQIVQPGGIIDTKGGGSIKTHSGSPAPVLSWYVQGGSGGNILTHGGDGIFFEDDPAVGGSGGYISTKGADAVLDMGGKNGANGGYIDTSGIGKQLYNPPVPGYGPGGYINTSGGGGNIDTRFTGAIQFGYSTTRTVLCGTATQRREINLPNKDGTLSLITDIVPTTTNYLSTNNVIMLSATVLSVLSASTIASNGSIGIISDNNSEAGEGNNTLTLAFTNGVYAKNNLTVVGLISTNNDYTSKAWKSVYTTVNTNSGNYILDGGNTKDASITIGTNDEFNLNLKANNTTRLTIISSGIITINAPNLNTLNTSEFTGSNLIIGLNADQSTFFGYANSTTWNNSKYVAEIGRDTVDAGFLKLWRQGVSYSLINSYTGDSYISGGSLGIGTKTPTSRLDVRGIIKAEGGNSNEWNTAYRMVSSGPYVLNEPVSAISTYFGSNTANGLYSAVLGGELNKVTGDYSTILNGTGNLLTHNSSFIIGNDITSDASNFTFVNNLKAENTVNAENSTINSTINVPYVNAVDSIIGPGQEMVISDGINLDGHGTNTLTLNFDKGVYISNSSTNELTVEGNAVVSYLTAGTISVSGATINSQTVTSLSAFTLSAFNMRATNMFATSLTAVNMLSNTLSTVNLFVNTITHTTPNTAIDYTASGTYTFKIPAGYKWIKITAIGGGGGGGGGGKEQGTTGAKRGGGGGASGGYTTITYLVSSLSATGTPIDLSISVGAGGGGGNGATTSPGGGTNGTAGSNTTVTLANINRTIAYAPGGRAGTAGIVGTNGYGGGGIADIGTSTGLLAGSNTAIGGDSSTTSQGETRPGQDNAYGPGGGGAGGAVSSSGSVVYNGASGGIGSRALGLATATTGGTGKSDGTSATAGGTASAPSQFYDDILLAGGGGAGGGGGGGTTAPSGAVTGGAGGNGVLGGGGGGGGSTGNTVSSGNGGAGGSGGTGAVRIYLYN